MIETKQSPTAPPGCAPTNGSDECRLNLMEDPEMEWANELGSLSDETKELVAQLSCQARVIQQYRRECAEKDARRRSAEAHNQILLNALSLAINTVECASTDGRGNELPWYRAAKTALALSPNESSSPIRVGAGVERKGNDGKRNND